MKFKNLLLRNLLLRNLLLRNLLPSSFYKRDTVLVAKDLIGKILVRKIEDKYIAGIISETEAYTHDDPASHCYYKTGITKRNKVMFDCIGCAYVYLSYGIHYCFNVSARDPKVSQAGGILIRAVIPIEGLNLIKQYRKINNLKHNLKNLTNGPGKLTQAFQIDLTFNGVNLTDYNSKLFITLGDKIDESKIQITPRIGISKAIDKPWRFLYLE